MVLITYFLRRHNLVCNTLASIGYSARLSIGREHSFQGVKSADDLFRDFDFGRCRDLAVDVTIRNPFRLSNGGLGVADAAEALKVSKHGRSCEQLNVGFVGFGMDTFGVLLALCWVALQRQLHTMIEYLVLLLFQIAGVRFLFLSSSVLVKVWLISNFLN